MTVKGEAAPVVAPRGHRQGRMLFFFAQILPPEASRNVSQRAGHWSSFSIARAISSFMISLVPP